MKQIEISEAATRLTELMAASRAGEVIELKRASRGHPFRLAHHLANRFHRIRRLLWNVLPRFARGLPRVASR